MTLPGPFAGLTVVELGQFIVVPFCAQLMADGGARVIKVEPVEGDNYRRYDAVAPMESRAFLSKNRGKESIAVAIGDPGGAEVVRRLVATADVVLVNMSPAAVERRGLGYEAVRALNPTVVYGAVTGFGRSGPEAGLAGMDVVVQARSGLLTALGAERDGVPLHSEVQAADYSTSLLLLAGVASALFARERTGVGQRVDASLLGGALTMQNNVLTHVEAVDGWRLGFTDDELPRLRAEGASGEEVEGVRRSMRPDPPRLTALYRVFRSADGYVAIGAGSPGLRARLLEVTGLDVGALPADSSDGKGVLPGEDVGQRLADLVATRPTAEWVATMRQHAIPVAEVKHVDEMLFDAQAEAEGLVADFDHEVVGRYRSLGTPIQLSGTPFRAESPSPPFARHTRGVLIELGYTNDEVDDLARTGVVVTAGIQTREETR